jgi:hypothetical protein
MLKKEISLLVSSCDNYSDLWPLFSFYFEKNWPNCNLDKYILSNHSNFSSETFKSIKVGYDQGWSSNLILALEKIKTDYVFILLDDVFISQKVDNSLFEKICKEFISNEGNYLKFLTLPKSKVKSNSQYFNTLPTGSLYRSTAVFALWKRKTLLSILINGENAWDFEIQGSIRSDDYDKFFVVKKDFFYFIHSVVRGNFLKSAWKKIQMNEPQLLEFVKRPINTRTFEIRKKIFDIRHKLFYFFIPLKYRRVVRELVFKIKII